MRDIIQDIADKVTIEKEENFLKLLNQCLRVTTTPVSTYIVESHVTFHLALYFKGLSKVSNTLTKDKKSLFGINTLKVILDELGFDIEKEDAFIMFHLRDLGKFKIKTDKLREQLQKPWEKYPDYALDAADFAHTIKVLRRKGLLEYRKGSLTLNLEIEAVERS